MKRLAIPLAVLGLGVGALLLLQEVSQFSQAQQPGGLKPPPGKPNPGGQLGFQGGAGVLGGGPGLPGGGPLPPAPPVGKPTVVTTKEGKKGWKVQIPGNKPLATPAVADGKVFIGGGFGSHEFYAFDAKTGKKVWMYRTGDDGPTAAVVQDGYIAFNTESCELEIITMDGKRVWKKWLGDPLMSMPAIGQGKVYMAYPNSKGDGKQFLACFDLQSGKEEWKKPLAGEIITAPVLRDDQLFVATLEGSLYCFKHADGTLVWREEKNATSSPTVWNGKCYFSRREAVAFKDKKGKEQQQQTEKLAARGVGEKDTLTDLKETEQKADYLDYAKRAKSPQELAFQKHDAMVGFGAIGGLGGVGGQLGKPGGIAGAGQLGKAPSAQPGQPGLQLGGGFGQLGGQLAQSTFNLGQSSVTGLWSYQGSRPFVYNDRLYSSMGDAVKCVDPKTEKIVWQTSLAKKTDKEPVVNSLLTPPVLVNGKVFVCTSSGAVVCLDAENGKELWRATLTQPILFQPAVANGRVYVSTSTGYLYCLETGDENDDGWMMWGGNAAHNGLIK
jgi:outer membrane protein assembly factor BamB